MTLSPGATFGRYQIVAPIGGGGMGSVYRARDPKLQRDVAIKILNPDIARNEDYARRFVNEARSISRLNHPAIVTIHEYGTEPEPFLVMELVEGTRLRDLLLGGPIPPRRAVNLAVQVAEGLAAAHEAGIVHRDLKPDNIMVTPDNRAKILDFGLAKLAPVELGGGSQMTTLADDLTRPGAIVGTVGYMAPEQARGEEADFAADQFSFGSILYEMCTGRRAFGRKSAIETLSAILREEPEPIDLVNPAVPAPLRWIIGRCLAKSRKERYGSTQDLARELSDVRDHFSELTRTTLSQVSLPRIRISHLREIAAGALLLGIGAAAAWVVKGKPGMAFAFERLSYRKGLPIAARFSPDGRAVAYGGVWEEGDPGATYETLLASPLTDRLIKGGNTFPMAFDPSGSRLLMVSNIPAPSFFNPTGTLGWVPTLGGDIRPLLPHVAWADWSETAQLYAVVLDEHDVRSLALADRNGKIVSVLDRTTGGFFSPRFSRDGRLVAYIHVLLTTDDVGLVRVVAAKPSAKPRNLTPAYADITGLAWQPHTREVWFTAADQGQLTTLRAVDMAGRVRNVYSAPVPLRLFDVSEDGARILLGALRDTGKMLIAGPGTFQKDLTIFDLSSANDISSDGRFTLFSHEGTEVGEPTTLWMRSTEGGVPVRLGDGDYGVFSPDGSKIAALTLPAAGPTQIIAFPTGPGSVRQITHEKGSFSTVAFSSDGSHLLAAYAEGAHAPAIWSVSLDGKRLAQLTPPGCLYPTPSPDGTEVAAACDNFRRIAVFATGGTPLPRELREIWKTDDHLRAYPVRWSVDGDKIYAFMGSPMRLAALPAAGGGPAQTIQDFSQRLPRVVEHIYNASITPDGRYRIWTVGGLEGDLYSALMSR